MSAIDPKQSQPDSNSEIGAQQGPDHDAISDGEFEDFRRFAQVHRLKRGQILEPGLEGNQIASVLSGTIKIVKSRPDGREQIVGLLFPTDFLSNISSAESPGYAEAATDAEICYFSPHGFEGFLAAHPGLELRLLQRVLNELNAAREWMFLLGRKSAEEKVASFLHMITSRMTAAGIDASAPDGVRFTLPLSRAEIADFLGLRIETVSRQLSLITVSGAIELPNKRDVVVRSQETLVHLAGDAAPTE